MKINVALFITALSTTSSGRHGVLPVVSAAAAGDDGAAAAATTTVDRPHLRALQVKACPKFISENYGDQNTASNSCTPDYCSGCDSQYSSCFQDSVFDNDVAYNKKGCCSTSNNDNNCFGKNEEEDSMFIKADEEAEEEVPQDTTATTDKLGDEIEARSSTLRASSLLKDNVFTKKDGVAAEDFLEVATCPSPVQNAPSDPCTATTENHYLDCSECNGKPRCVPSESSNSGIGSGNQWSAKCCHQTNDSNCVDSSAQADEEDAVSLLKVE